MKLAQYLETTSQAEFAKAIGVSQGLVSHWITGRSRVPAERVLTIEQATGGQVTRHDLREDLYPIEQAA